MVRFQLVERLQIMVSLIIGYLLCEDGLMNKNNILMTYGKLI